jgi:hypothetical protein
MNSAIPIHALLMEREDLLVDVSELERQISQILGEPYPFEVPKHLPSLQRRKKKRKTGRSRAPAAVRLRPLDPEKERAYRIRYIQKNEERTEIHLDPKPLIRLLNTPIVTLVILSIETVRVSDDNGWEPVETLFSNTAQSPYSIIKTVPTV